VTDVERDHDLEELVGNDAFGRSTPAQEDHLRSPQMRFEVRSTLRLMIASLEDQLANRAGPEAWRTSAERYLSRLKVSLVEFDALCGEQDSIYRRAIEAHRDKVLAEFGPDGWGGSEPYDQELWSVLESCPQPGDRP
jgi:hypothetical protein